VEEIEQIVVLRQVFPVGAYTHVLWPSERLQLSQLSTVPGEIWASENAFM